MPVVTKYPQAYNIVDGAWNNPPNGYSDDGAYFDIDGVRNTSFYIHFSDFGFTIPAGSTINAITFEIEYKVSSTASAGNIYLSARYDGSTYVSFNTTNEPLTDTLFQGVVQPYVFSVEQLNSSLLAASVGVRMTGNKACNYMFDYVSVTVDYTEPSNDKTGSVYIVTSGTVTVNGKKAASGSAEITGTASEEAGGKKNSASAVSITATGTVTFEGQQTISKFGPVSIVATSGIEIAGSVNHKGAASITAATDVVTAGKSTRTGEAEITTASGVTTAGKKTSTGATDITGATEAEAAGRKDTSGQTLIEAAAMPVTDGAKCAGSAISIASASTVTVYGTGALGPIDKTGVVEITAAATVNISGAKRTAGSASLYAAGQASAVGTKSAKGSPSIVSVASLASVGKKAADGLVEIALIGSVTINGERKTTLADPAVEAELIEYFVEIDLAEMRPELAIIDNEIKIDVIIYELELSDENYSLITEVIGVPYIGATVRLNATFPTDAGDLAGLTQVKCVITDSDRNIIDTIDGDDIQAGVAEGQYFAYYNIPDTGVGDLSYAWSGHLGEDLILLARKAIRRIWQD